MSFPRYPTYKDSGVECLGQVPGHWDVVPLKTIIDRIESGVSVNAVDTPASEGESGVLKTSCVYHGEFEPAENKAVVRDEYHRLACPVTVNTLIVSRMNTPDLVGAAGLVRQSESNLFLPDRLWQVHFRGTVPCYVHYWSHTPSYRAQVQMACAGTSSSMQNLSQEDFRSFLVTRPNQIEQAQIVAFLDRETTKIDGLVAEQRRLMELLKEKRQAVIAHAVTQGLNPDAPMKPSNIEWLGNVPAHWDVLKGSLIGTLFGSEQVPEESVQDEGDLPFIKVGSLSRDSFEIESWNYFVDRIEATAYRPRCGYIVFPKRGAAIFTNKVNIVDRPSLIDPNLMGWEIGDRAVTAFIAYALKSRGLDELADVSTVPQINNKHIAPERFPVPPVQEQHKIVAFLHIESAKFDTLTTEAQRAIDLLQERRTALISAAVTGQIDVRKFV